MKKRQKDIIVDEEFTERKRNEIQSEQENR